MYIFEKVSKLCFNGKKPEYKDPDIESKITPFNQDKNWHTMPNLNFNSYRMNIFSTAISITKVKFRWTFGTSNGNTFIRVHNILSFQCSAMILAVNDCYRMLEKKIFCLWVIHIVWRIWMKSFWWYGAVRNFIIQTNMEYLLLRECGLRSLKQKFLNRWL